MRDDDDEAGVRALIDQRAITGVSPSWVSAESDSHDVRICTGPMRAWTRLAPWEFSLLSGPNRPRFTDTWVSKTAAALAKRQKLIAA